MTKQRLIPVLLLKNGKIVRSAGFEVHQIIGNPISTMMRLSNWDVDELIVLDISTSDFHDLGRDDLFIRYQSTSLIDLLRNAADVSAMPLTVGGRLRSLEGISQRLAAGADKICLTTAAVTDPDLIREASRHYGSQCIVAGIDVKRHDDGRYEVCIDGGSTPTGLDPVAHAQACAAQGAGEILLQSIDRDGMAKGYDTALVKSVVDAVSVPVIALGGAGDYTDFIDAVDTGGASAAAAANIFNFFELAYPRAKKACIDAGLDMRPAVLDDPLFAREPSYETVPGRIQERLDRAAADQGPKRTLDNPPTIHWCRNCVYPSVAATPMAFDEKGVCMGCRTSDQKFAIDDSTWAERKDRLAEIIERYRDPDGGRPDCIIGVSGGKDSYFQTHVIRNELGFRPLLVTYYGNNYSKVGNENLWRMKEVFDVDHVIVQPSVPLLKKLNRFGFYLMGDMNWHNHLGIASVPMMTGARYGCPLVIWGEHGYADLSGQFDMDDFVEWTYRYRLEHFARGYDWQAAVGFEGITAQDMQVYRYPSDQAMFDLDLRGLYLSNFVKWEANDHLELVQKEYGFKIAEEAFDRTYRLMSNLDDIHENGLHDYLRYIKFGYGRCTDHASKDVRAGRMDRAEAVRRVRHYDHVKPSDLERWLEYTGLDERHFDQVCDTFRDTRVWRSVDGAWTKDHIWDESGSQ